MKNLLTNKALKAFFKNQKLKCIIKKGGATMFDNIFNNQEQINQIKEQLIVEETEQIKTKEESTKAPLTLEEARQKLEYEMLNNYLSSLSKEQAENFLNTQVNLTSELKQKLLNNQSLNE